MGLETGTWQLGYQGMSRKPPGPGFSGHRRRRQGLGTAEKDLPGSTAKRVMLLVTDWKEAEGNHTM